MAIVNYNCTWHDHNATIRIELFELQRPCRHDDNNDNDNAMCIC